MAIVIAPLHSIQVRGRCGGISFRRWRDMNIAANYAPSIGNPVDPSFLSWGGMAALWGGLTNNQRESWRQYAKNKRVNNGPLKPNRRSGYMTFCLQAYAATRCGETVSGEPPTMAEPNYPIGIYVYGPVGGFLGVGWDPDQEGDYMEVHFEQNHSPGVRIYDYKIGLFGYATVGSEDIRGSMAQANKIHRAKVRLVRANGQSGPWGYANLET